MTEPSPTLAQLKERPHYSYSAIATYLNCPLLYCFRYVEKLPAERTPAALPFGTAFHSAMSEQARAAQKGELAKPSELKDIFAEYFKAGIAGSPKVVFKEGDNTDSLIGLAGRMLETATSSWPDFHQTIAGVAVPFRFEIDGLSKPIVGEYDLLVKEPTPFDEPEDDRYVTIVDWKTAAHMWPDSKAGHELQATVYTAAYEAVHSLRPSFRFDVTTKTKTPKTMRFYTSRMDGQIERMKSITLAVDKAVNAGVFLPNDNSLNCLDCPYASTCAKWHCRDPHGFTGLNVLHPVAVI